VSAPPSILDYRQPVLFHMGEVLIRSWNVLSRHFLTFAVMVGIAQLIPLLVTLYWGSPSHAGRVAPGETAAFTFGVVAPMQFVLSSFTGAIVVFAAFQDLRGRPVSATESFRQGVSRLLPVLVASFLRMLLEVFGFMLCMIPGLVAMAALVVVMPACVVERLGPIQSMSRSADLTSGHRWPIVGVSVAWLFLVLIVSLSIHAAIPGPTGLPERLLTWAWDVVSGSYSAVFAAILYHDLRAVREGIGIDEIASAFD